MGERELSEIIGIIPGAGRASRIGGFFKELTPINVSTQDQSKFVVVSERMVDLVSAAGANPIYFVLNSDKIVISDYFSKSNLFTKKDLFFSYQDGIDKYYGMPFAIDKIYNQAKGKIVLLGMPDTLIEPDDSFKVLLQRFSERGSDLELGIYKTAPGNFGGFVEFDEHTGRVTRHIDKTSDNFPEETADNAWAIACWNDRFTEFMHKFVNAKRDEYRYTGIGEFKELLFGDIIDAAMVDGSFSINADFISERYGYYLDITEPAKYFDAVLHYHGAGEEKQNRRRAKIEKSTKKKRIFISHSSLQKGHADNLHFMLKQAGFEPKLDAYDIDGGDELSRRIESLIDECDYFVLLLSEACIASKWVQFEITLAYARGMLKNNRLLPVELEHVPDDIANSLPLISRNQYNWLDGTKGMRVVVDWFSKKR